MTLNRITTTIFVFFLSGAAFGSSVCEDVAVLSSKAGNKLELKFEEVPVYKLVTSSRCDLKQTCEFEVKSAYSGDRRVFIREMVVDDFCASVSLYDGNFKKSGSSELKATRAYSIRIAAETAYVSLRKTELVPVEPSYLHATTTEGDITTIGYGATNYSVTVQKP